LIYTGNGYQSPGTGSVPTSSGTETKQTNDSTIINNGVPKARPAVQYASLCLGALHYMFGHLEQARRSIDESMRVAQIYGKSVVVVVVVLVAVVVVVVVVVVVAVHLTRCVSVSCSVFVLLQETTVA